MNKKLLRGSLNTIVLKLLEEHGEMYGYEITQKVKELSNDKILITEGALYPLLHRLEANGDLSVEHRPACNRVRKYYSLTPKGTTELQQLLQDMQDYLGQMQLLLNLKPSYE